LNDVSSSVSAEQNEQQPDLTRLFKNRRRCDSVVKAAKTLLVLGHPVHKVALLLRLDPEFVATLAETWNPRFRRVTYTNQFATRQTARLYFESGALLAAICKDLQLPLYTVVAHLTAEGVTDQQMAERMPGKSDPLYIEYIKTVKRVASRKQKSPQLH